MKGEAELARLSPFHRLVSVILKWRKDARSHNVDLATAILAAGFQFVPEGSVVVPAKATTQGGR